MLKFGTVSVRKRKVGDLGSMKESEFVEKVLSEIKTRNRD